MKKSAFSFAALIAALTVFGQLSGAAAAPQKATLAIAKISAGAALEKKAEADGSAAVLARIAESMDSALTSAIQATRKFELVSRKDLDAVMAEIALSNSGNADSSDANAAKAGRIKGAKYLLAVSIDDFQDLVEKASFAGVGKTVQKRALRLGATAKIIDSSSASILETAEFSVEKSAVAEQSTKIGLKSTGDYNDALISEITREMSAKIAARLADAVFPARIVAKTGDVATINRGDSTSVSIGDEYAVFALGDRMTDPDTGEDLGAEEVMVGRLKIVWQTPKTSQGRLLMDNGVERGQIVRLVKKAGADE